MHVCMYWCDTLLLHIYWDTLMTRTCVHSSCSRHNRMLLPPPLLLLLLLGWRSNGFAAFSFKRTPGEVSHLSLPHTLSVCCHNWQVPLQCVCVCVTVCVNLPYECVN